MTRALASSLATLVLASGLLAGLGCSEPPARPNLLFLVVDSLRSDRLAPYGSERPTPAISALARQGVVFEQSYSSAPWTMPSVATMFTGLAPTRHGVTNTDALMSEELETLAERLLSRGYATSAVVSHHMIGKKFRFDQGFESFDQELARGHRFISSELLTQLAGRELKRLSRDSDGKPFFLFVHYFDPHYDYRDHPQYEYAKNSAGRLKGNEGIGQLRRMLDSMSEEELDFIRDRYDEEVRFTDAAIGRLLDRLKRLGLAENTLVVFTADHGEEFRDHGWLGHTQSLYRELVHVPLVMRGPGLDRMRRFSAPVSAVDLAPTLLELLGFRESLGDGTSLVPRLRQSEVHPAPPVFCEVDYLGVDEGQPGLRTCHKKSVVGESFQLVRDDESGEVELFRHEGDEAQIRNLAEELPEEVARLTALLDAHLARLATGARELERTEFDEAELSELRELGYVDSEEPEPEAPLEAEEE